MSAVIIDWVTVGNPGNSADASMGYGAVGYTYQIGKYEVTNAQYAEFLNAKAASDPLSLYNTNMSNSPMGGIDRSGVSGAFTYSVKSGYANMPVVYVSFFDSIRFANWVNNGQGSASTETGSYTLTGNSPVPFNGDSVTRNSGAKVVLTNGNEWYKAAYYEPAATPGGTDQYWLYPTRSNVEPNSDQPPGDPSLAGNVANFKRDDGIANGFNDGFAVSGSTTFVTGQNYITSVGAFSGSSSYYGTFDQAGNVQEWSEDKTPAYRYIHGGDWLHSSILIPSSSFITYTDPGGETYASGFRLAVVPEPAAGVTFFLLMVLGPVQRCRRRARPSS